jgi:hypothetical protein
MISWRMKLTKLIKFKMGSAGYNNTEYIIKDNNYIGFYFSQESNGLYIVSIIANNTRYDLKNCKRLSEYQKNLFIHNFYHFTNESLKGILDINDFIENLSNEDFTDE